MSGYGEEDSTAKSLMTLGAIALFSFVFLFYWDVFTLLERTSASFRTSFLPDSVIFFWRMSCLLVSIYAIIYMFRMKTGTMVVLDHETRSEVTLHPLGIRKFVTFSSWTLICSVVYFLLATLSSLSLFSGSVLPTWINIAQVLFFTMALGAGFLTSTVVRYVILPAEVKQKRVHEHQFYFHNQMMHNFTTIFLAFEIVLVQPELRPHFAIFGLIIGTLYALFAFPFAYFGGGYYVYSFIDPRLKLAPLFVSGLAGAISLFYLGLWLISLLVGYNGLIGGVAVVIWLSLIVQFQPEEIEYEVETNSIQG